MTHIAQFSGQEAHLSSSRHGLLLLDSSVSEYPF